MLARTAAEIRKVSHYIRQAVTTSSHWHQVPVGEDRKPRRRQWVLPMRSTQRWL
jgi:hypothetical protein